MPRDLNFNEILRSDLPASALPWNGFPKYNFIGGHNDPDSIPVDDIIQATSSVLKREGKTLATYRLQSGPLGYKPLREFVAEKLAARSGFETSPDNILITSGSGQGLDLVNSILCQPGDIVIVEQFSYGSAISRLRQCGVKPIGIPLDVDGMKIDVLAGKLNKLRAQNMVPKYIYVIPTIQNPSGSIMSEARRRELLSISEKFGIPIVEDECYADLIWDGGRPPAIAAMDSGNRVIHCGSFSKTIAPALRVGYIVADWELISRMISCKNDGGTGALEQMMLAEYCKIKFDSHLTKLNVALEEKRNAMIKALDQYFGTSAEFEIPRGGIFLWITLPDRVDALKLAQAAASEGVAINPGPEWASDVEVARSKLRLCFGHPEKQVIRDGIKLLAEICHRKFGVPVNIDNVDRD